MSLQQHFNPIEDYDDPDFIAHQIANFKGFPEYEPNDEEAIAHCEEIEAANQPLMTPDEEYELMAGSDDLVADALEALRRSDHPWTNFDEDDDDYLVAPEMVIDDMIAVGRQTIAGTRGVGKSVTCASLSMQCTHLVDGAKPSIRRRVVYIAEDTKQIKRVIRSMQESGILTRDMSLIRQWFIIVPSKRMDIDEIKDVADAYGSLKTPNRKLDGSIHWAEPLIVVDTYAANIIVDKLEDNTEHSKVHAMFRENFGEMPIWLVTHVVKKAVGRQNRNKVHEMSAIGGQSLEADANGTAYIFEDSKGLCLCIGKDRVEVGVKVYDIGTTVNVIDSTTPLQNHTTQLLRHNHLTPVSQSEVKERVQVAQELDGTMLAIYQTVKKHPGLGRTALFNQMVADKVLKSRTEFDPAYDAITHEDCDWLYNGGKVNEEGVITRPKWYINEDIEEMPDELLNPSTEA